MLAVCGICHGYVCKVVTKHQQILRRQMIPAKVYITDDENDKASASTLVLHSFPQSTLFQGSENVNLRIASNQSCRLARSLEVTYVSSELCCRR